jgi:hypothetical protein
MAASWSLNSSDRFRAMSSKSGLTRLDPLLPFAAGQSNGRL